MKTFIFIAKNSSITVTVSANNQDEAFQEICEYFGNNGVEDLRLSETEDEFYLDEDDKSPF